MSEIYKYKNIYDKQHFAFERKFSEKKEKRNLGIWSDRTLFIINRPTRIFQLFYSLPLSLSFFRLSSLIWYFLSTYKQYTTITIFFHEWMNLVSRSNHSIHTLYITLCYYTSFHYDLFEKERDGKDLRTRNSANISLF